MLRCHGSCAPGPRQEPAPPSLVDERLIVRPPQVSSVKALLFIFLFCVAGAKAQGMPSGESVRRAEVIATETIPRLELKEATFEEALKMIQRAWDERHPTEPLPIGLSDYQPPEGYRETQPARITLDLKNVPFLEALHYIGRLSGRHLVSLGGVIQMERYRWIEEGWTTRVHEVTPKALAALHLKPDSSGEELRRGFQQLGVRLDDWMNLGMTPSGQGIFVHAYPSQQEQIAGILFLLNNGFRITK